MKEQIEDITRCLISRNEIREPKEKFQRFSSPNRRYSLFTRHSLDHIDKPNFEIHDMLTHLCKGVLSDSNDELKVH